ncbi:MAG: radical SAM protein [Myxococcota bacterium]|nr:radical SAM protein [Myxococcota bacterium]
MLKPSFYNHLVKLEDSSGVLYNFYTLCLLALTPEDVSAATAVLAEPDAAPNARSSAGEMKQLLIDKGFLIDASIDELAHLRASRASARTSRHLSLTVLPSLACNFRCIYCYETPNNAAMSPAVEAALATYIETHLTPGGKLHITWFGGEPLLELDRIRRLTRQMRQISDNRGAGFDAAMISNGYLLSEPVAKELAELGVKRVQVTIDGPEDIHNQRRPTAGGGETYETILANLKGASQWVSINLRINVDQTNRDCIDALLDRIVDDGLKERVHPYLGRTYPYTDVCADAAGSCIADADFSLLSMETDLALVRRGFSAYRLPKTRNAYCMAESSNAMPVLPDGGLVRCWNDAANPDALVGHLLTEATPQMKENDANWQHRDPFELECQTCKLLPICMGGCPYLYRCTSELHCHEWKHHLDESIIFHYYLKTLEREGEIVAQFNETAALFRRS